MEELQLSLRSIWSWWSDVSVPEVKKFLDLIINMGLIPLPDIKYYWFNERKTHFFFCEMIPPNKAVGTSKGQESTWVDRTYRETVSEKLCAR
jgi:hypothetical protein